jgi:hypothetical protein
MTAEQWNSNRFDEGSDDAPLGAFMFPVFFPVDAGASVTRSLRAQTKLSPPKRAEVKAGIVGLTSSHGNLTKLRD